MGISFHVTFRDIERSEAIEEAILKKAEALFRIFPRIVDGTAIVEAPHKHHHKGRRYHVRIDLSVPGKVLVVNREPGLKPEHEDAYIAIRDAFEAAKRELRDYADLRRGESRRRPEAGT